jgi:hypothetical protein
VKWERIDPARAARCDLSECAIKRAFDALSERDALKLFARMSERFSYSRGHDLVHDGVQEIAMDAAQAEGWEGDDLASRYLDDDG